jgi:hypothetical protein
MCIHKRAALKRPWLIGSLHRNIYLNSVTFKHLHLHAPAAPQRKRAMVCDCNMYAMLAIPHVWGPPHFHITHSLPFLPPSLPPSLPLPPGPWIDCCLSLPPPLLPATKCRLPRNHFPANKSAALASSYLAPSFHNP